ncbi:MAG: metallophosphoesterase [Gammaproteobacteria bacterium]|nr:metallophosphoesterase [Gammaproteobacteria bacterium]MBP6051156.1 metallophosphoesterase [Pseudomonadales bacterium]MBK6584261.1 metallophosphoesterase [Gammaproteobacteria bacterium]MBK7168493.1 metallophosphoesterase [Gammaproteobacteria bacterium]MBK7520444.1 metallophosphoesterase [Gammaproteobacteria bacterium]
MSAASGPMQTPFRFAQLSDPHLSDLSSVRWRQLASKRLLGYLSWRRRRRHEHRIEMLDALRADLQTVAPDHTVVTGDLTHIALPSEFREARDWLRSVGTPERVTVVPGNHDCYIATPWVGTLGLWSEYMRSDHAPANTNPEVLFPSLRVRGPVAFIGLSSAVPSWPLLAIGRLGSAQLDRLQTILDSLRNSGLLRVLLLHHPPVPGEEKWRKRLVDAAKLGELLGEHRVDMVLHGHRHRAIQSAMRIPGCEVPVFGIPSASAAGKISNYPSEYNLYAVRPGERSWNIEASARSYDARNSGFRERIVARFEVLRHAAH